MRNLIAVLVAAAFMGWAGAALAQPVQIESARLAAIAAAGSEQAQAAFNKAHALEAKVGKLESDLACAKADMERRIVGAGLRAVRLSRELEEGKRELAYARAEAARLNVELVRANSVKEATIGVATMRESTVRAQLSDPNPTRWVGVPGLPGEDPIRDITRPGCPKGSTPEYVKIGENVRFVCNPIVEDEGFTDPARKPGVSKYVKCLAGAAVGAGVGAGGSYGIARAAKHSYGVWDALGSSVGGAAIGYGACLLFIE